MNHDIDTAESAELTVRTILTTACATAGLEAGGAELLRYGENALYRLPGGIVARIARGGQHAAAQREVRVAAWLADNDVPAVRPTTGVDQPVIVADRAVTFWDELPPHRTGTPAEVADALRRLHSLAPPAGFHLPQLDPFVRIGTRIDAATILTTTERTWLHQRLDELRDRYAQLPPGLAHSVVHGDASDTNLAVTADGTITLLDFERCTIGPPEWDLTSTAVELGYRWITPETYQEYSRRYGHDVTTWAGYETLRDIRELRMTSWMAQQASDNPAHHDEARHRLECLHGHHGPRPWNWKPL